MATFYRIRYKVNGPNKSALGTRVVTLPIARYIDVIRKEYPDATLIYLELEEEFEVEEETATESIIIMC